jgi:hypothetical protein
LDPPRPDDRFQLVFSGECIDGFDPQAVRQAVVAALKFDEKRALRLFSGKPVVLRRQVDAATAQRYIARFATMGAVLHAELSKLPPRPVARASRWRPLQWAGIGVLCIALAVLLGLALGPMLDARSPEASAPGSATSGGMADASQSPPLAPAAADVSSTKMPPKEAPARPATDADIPKEMTAAAVSEYRLGYLAATNHKAFAISSGGVHAWIAGAPSESDARERALASCMGAVQSASDACRVVDADGNWEN